MVGSIPTGPSDVPPIDANLRSERLCDDQCHPSGPKTLKKDLVAGCAAALRWLGYSAELSAHQREPGS